MQQHWFMSDGMENLVQGRAHPGAATGRQQDGGEGRLIGVRRGGAAHASGSATLALRWEGLRPQGRTMALTILFDLDGTLVDTAPDLTAALNHALAVLGRPPIPAGDVRHMVGRGVRALLERGLAATGAVSDELVDAGVTPFLDFYARNIAVGSRPFPGVETAMDRLAAAGHGLAVCTNKPQALADRLIATLGWTARFRAVVGADSVPARKPDPGHVLATLAAAGGEASRALFVGDSRTDAEAARAAGLPLVLVRFGYSEEAVDELGAGALIGHFDGLEAAVRQLAPA
jgi:phosphoglycolate phosphatase